MAGKHLSEIDIQQIILDKEKCSAEEREHYNICDECKTEAAKYSRLFAAIKQQEKPVFDFDLTEMIMKELPVPQHVSRFDNYFVFSIMTVAICLVASAFYFFRIYISEFFINIPANSVYFILTTVVSVVIIVCEDVISRFRKLFKILNSI